MAYYCRAVTKSLRGTPLIKWAGGYKSWHHFIAEAISPVRSENKNKEQKPTTPAHSE
jgi:hypothetical protein